MGLFDFLSSKKEQPPQEERKLVKEDFYVTGTYYHQTEIKRLQNANPDWRKSGKTLVAEGKVMQRIYHYSYINKPVKIAVDNGSVYKKGALMVIIAGEHVGFIKDEDLEHVRSILNKKSVKYVTASISGGEFKIVSENGDAVKWENDIKINLRIAYA